MYNSLSNRVIIVVSLSVIVVVSLASYFTFITSMRTINETALRNLQEILALHTHALERYIDDLSSYSLNIRKNEVLMRAILHDEPPGYHDIVNLRSIKNIFYGRTDIYNFFLYLPRQGRVYEISRNNPNLRIYSELGIRENAWYLSASQGPSFAYFDPGNFDSDGRQLLTLYRAIINIQDQETIAIVKLSVIPEILAQTFSDDSRRVGIFDENGRVIYTNDSTTITDEKADELFARAQHSNENMAFSVALEGGYYMAIINRSENLGWTSLFVVPANEVYGAIEYTQTVLVWIGGGAVATAILLIVLLIKVQTRSLVRLINNVSEIRDYSLNAQISEKGNPEVANLARAINSMLRRIQELVSQNFVSKINEKEAQLKNLETQLNSHFLYNTLQAISSKALMAENREVSDMVNALAYTLRYLVKSDGMVRIENELAHLNRYFLLQKARFEERLITNIEVEEKALTQYIPKLSIQILAENSIKHGLEKMLGAININVRIYVEEEYLYIKVSDDGGGITPERLNEVREAIQRKEKNCMIPKPNIGLGSLTVRLELLYSGQASFDIYSQEGIGATSVIKLPYEGK